MKNKKNILCGAFAMLALSLAGGSLAFSANADEQTKTLDNISIDMVKGASMRIAPEGEANNEATTGLRFTMQVSAADYNALKKSQYSSIEWGMLIAPVEYVDNAPLDSVHVFGENAVYYAPESENEAIPEGKKAVIKVSETELTLASDANLPIDNAENYYVFSGYMHSIKPENLTRGFVGRGYVKYTVGDNAPQYVFANYAENNVENNTRSAYYVAQRYVNDHAGTETASYVQTNYLDNATALKTAEIEVAAEDYMEDITIGTYGKTPVHNTIALKIGTAYDAANEEMNKKDGYKLVSVSGTAMPLYRGQKFSIRRYYESNDYIPFSNTAGAVTETTAEDGEEVAGAYKYTTSRSADTGLKFAAYTDVEKDKLIRGKAASASGKYLVGYVNMQFRWKTTNAGGFNLVSQLGDFKNDYNTDWCVSANWFNAKGTMLGGISFYKESGYPVKRVDANTWYKVAFPVYTNYHDGARFGSMFLQIDATTGSGDAATYSEQTVYFKDVTISEKDIYAEQVPETPDPEAYKPTIGSGGSCELVTEGNFKYAYKYTINQSGTEASALVFGNTSSPVYTAKYVTMEIYFENVNVIWTRDQLGFMDSKNNYFDWRKIGTDYATSDSQPVLFYDMDGNQVTAVQNNTWYKVAIPVKAIAGKNWGELIMAIEFTAPFTSAAVYVRNADYGNTNIYAK